MTKDELLHTLNTGTGDPERDHFEADEALVDYINDPDITAAWERASKQFWYA